MALYHLRNWPEYERALEARGSLSLYLTPAVVRTWRATSRAGARAARPRGRPRIYSDAAIRCVLSLHVTLRLGRRETVGLVRSIFQLLDLALPVPDHTTLSRRRARLPVRLPVTPGRRPRHVVVDATGIALVHEGSWQLHRSGRGPRPAWTRHYLRVHVAVDAADGELRALGISSQDVTEGEMLPHLLAALPGPLQQVTGDGAYASKRCYAAVAARPEQPRAVFALPRPRHPPRRPRIWQHGNTRGPPLDHDTHLRRIRQVGRAQWKREVDYHRRSLAETYISRDKRLFGDTLPVRAFPAQCAELFLRGALLNQFLWLGHPDSYPAA